MPRRRGRTIGAFIIGAGVLLLLANALLVRWPVEGLPSNEGRVASAERLLFVGTAVLAVDGTIVGKVSGLSRDPSGHVERIRVTGSIPMDSDQTTLIIRDTFFSVTEHAVQLKLSLAELHAMPRAMTEDKAAVSPRLF
jgi:hypothetical protein